jgi:hypothetical protein
MVILRKILRCANRITEIGDVTGVLPMGALGASNGNGASDGNGDGGGYRGVTGV